MHIKQTPSKTLHPLIVGLLRSVSAARVLHGSSTDPGHADRTQLQNYSEENEASVASALLNFDLVVLLSLGDLTLVSHEFNFDVRLDIYCTQPGARLLLNKMTLTGAVPAGRRLAVAEGGREGAQLLHR